MKEDDVKYLPDSLVTAAPAGSLAVFRVVESLSQGMYRLAPVSAAAEAYAASHKELRGRDYVEFHSMWLSGVTGQTGGRA